MKLCDLGEESRGAFVDFIKNAPEREAWEAISDAIDLKRRYGTNVERSKALNAIVDAGLAAYFDQFGEEWIPF